VSLSTSWALASLVLVSRCQERRSWKWGLTGFASQVEEEFVDAFAAVVESAHLADD